jgi:predicted CXXCH cytochrome family protein
MKTAQWLNAKVKKQRIVSSLMTFCKTGLMGSAMLLLACLTLSVTSCAAEKPTVTPAQATRINQPDPPVVVAAAPAEKSTGTPVPMLQSNQLKPLAAGATALSLHSPFADGNCILCHQKQDPKAPGPLLKDANEICLDCHEDFTQVLARKFIHAPAIQSCSNCHNSHNARYAKLLVDDVSVLCLSCHSELKSVSTEAKVKHDVTIKDRACINCHNPHGADVEHLLISLPFDLCITCHGVDGVIDHEGRELTNFKRLLAENPEHHGPVADKDCSACHNPHGAEYFRLLNQEYPPQFYSPYDPEVYAICFECHEERVFQEARTETLTLFRDGDVNLHYLHVNKEERGRTCRACHEVHASEQKHHIRAGVPYGSKGWVLKINYSPTPFGGTCGKNCHDSKSYTNRTASPGTVPQVRK